MEVKQIYSIVNNTTKEVLGEEVILQEDLSNIVDVGNAIMNNESYDRYVKSLCDHIGKVIFVDRPYSGSAPSVLMDSWEYGSVLEKISADIPEAEENDSWQLTNGQSYDPNVFYQPKVEAKFFSKKVTFDVPMSFTERQVKGSFDNATQLNGFLSMLYNSVDKSLTVKLDSLVMRTINNMIGETVYNEYATAEHNTKSGVRAVNLLKLYNDKFRTAETPLTVDEALNEPAFYRFATFIIGTYQTRLAKLSTLFNIGGKPRFTSSDMLHTVLLSDFKKMADIYLQSGTFHKEFTALPNADLVPYWQGSGKTYAFEDISKINIKTAGTGKDVEISGVLGVMFDRDSLGVSNLDRRVTSQYNPKGEFFNNWYKMDAGYFNDTNENFIVFFMA